MQMFPDVFNAFQTSYFRLQTSNPIIVKIVEPKEESLYDVLFGALGLTGVMVVIASPFHSAYHAAPRRGSG